VQKLWSLFFGAVLLACFLLTAISPFVGWWLPRNVSSFGGDVDDLWNLILVFTGFFFVLCSVILVYAMYRYAGREGGKAVYTHGNHRLELLWTAVPAAILLFIAFVQIRTWERIKYQSRMPEVSNDPRDPRRVHQVVQVTGRQWEWRIRYPNAASRSQSLVPRNPAFWAEFPEYDDVRDVNELHTWAGEDANGNKVANVKIYLKTNDVIHSFFLPNLRLKQDALPGKTIPMWFRATDSNCRLDEKKGEWVLDEGPDKMWEIACAELCGGRHYAMRGKLFVHKDEDDYRAWLKQQWEKQQATKPDKIPPPGSDTPSPGERVGG
jgi:cytochrome c oxidase subunit II